MKTCPLPMCVFAFATLSLFSALVTTPAFPQPLVNDHAVEMGGGFFYGPPGGALHLDMHYGYYLDSSWEAGLRQSLNFTFLDKAPTVWTATTAPFLTYNYHFFHNLVVFGGAFLGAVWNERDVTAALGPRVGLKFFLSGQVYFIPAYRYEWFFNSIKTGALRRQGAHHILTFGIGFVWGGSGRTERLQ